MSNPNSKVTLRLSPERYRVNEPLDVVSLRPFGFKQALDLLNN